jgi:hypothetical protein
MTSIKTMTTKANYRLGALVALAVLAMMATLLTASVPAHGSTTFTVNSGADGSDATPANGICDTDPTAGIQCTLRGAMQGANAIPGADTIKFDIPATRPVNILLDSSLPTITQQVTIDGYTQPGSSANTLVVGNDASLRIVLDASHLGGGPPIEIANSSGSVIKGLVVTGFHNDSTNIFITGDSFGNRIEGNFIGTDRSGTQDQTSALTGVGIDGGASGNVVGGTTPAARNIISGNTDLDVGVSGNDNRVQGNYIGTDRSGAKDLGNDGDGIRVVSASGTTIGGTTAAARNVISSLGSLNFGTGISVENAHGTRILGNRIGTTADGTATLGNGLHGVSISGDSTNSLVGNGTAGGSNTIAFNGGDGIAVADSTATGNRISRNSIFSNSGIGIDLDGGFQNEVGATANDAKDPDKGPNRLQNRPAITSAKTISGKTTVKGMLNSRPGTTYIVQFFSNPSGTDEGKTFLGQKSVSTDTSGKGTFTFSPTTKVAAGQTITATATRQSTGDTSEFSAPRTVAFS